MKGAYPNLTIILNGGVEKLSMCQEHFAELDGVMLGRAAYENPYLLSRVDHEVFGKDRVQIDRRVVVESMLPYIDAFLARGGRVHNVTRHMLGLFHGRPGARIWRQHLTMHAAQKDKGSELLTEALAKMPAAAFEDVAA